MKEGVLRVTDVDEGGFEAGIEVLDTALVDAADHAVVGLAFDFEFFEDAVDEEGDAFFEGLGVDDQFAEGGFLLLEHGDDLLEEGAVFRTLVGAGFEFGGIYRIHLLGWRRIGEFFVILVRGV
jgi:hypothetical protein